MNTQEVIKDLSKRMDAYKKDVRELILEHFRACLLDAARRGEKVRLAGIGTFHPRRSRRGREPRDGTRKLTVKFKPAVGFLRELNESKGDDGGER
ncbi:nucleoid DNA-binding protein [Thermodesulfitimonas autotrophica]|uniref:Nucleoid DNA-binding protein n=1 Tax=Thermodesulfitimonas autotrophica TaxID=1894989 RepID=A0A3N5AZE5_9THEO|nr:HU family DNA-binding protein [Thermodesulfitimonas autotrophica]RPF41992.1 nucleoid DNA-binding protein [Thermodesulfitimonas autotrophica]